MADTEYSNLPPVTTPLSTDQWGVNQGGISKSTTTEQVIGGTVAGAIPFVGSSGVLTQDSSNLFWDAVNNRLGLGTITPEGHLHISTGVSSAVNPTSQAKDFILQSDGDVGMTLFSPDANVSSFVFGSPGGTGNEGARLRWSKTNDLFSIVTTETNGEIRIAPGFLNTTMTLRVDGGEGHVGIGTTAPINTAKLDIVSTTQGFVPPRWTDAQEITNTGSLGAGDKGLMWFNTTSNVWSGWDGSSIVVIA